MLKRVKGDIIKMADEGQFNIIVHGCNCQNVMGSGIAKQLRNRWPSVYDADLKASKDWRVPVAKLGNFSFATTVSKLSNKVTIINAYTQLHYLPRGIDHFEYESFYLILRKLEIVCMSGVTIGFPYIGMGLAGGDPDRIIPMIENFAIKAAEKDTTVTLVEFEG